MNLIKFAKEALEAIDEAGPAHEIRVDIGGGKTAGIKRIEWDSANFSVKNVVIATDSSDELTELRNAAKELLRLFDDGTPQLYDSARIRELLK